jgi:hypothetical protein
MSDQEMDSLLRRSMAAPIPRLSPDFHQTLSRELRRNSEPAERFGRILLTGYGALSVVVCVIVMRAQGLGWTTATLTTLGPLAALELTRRLRRTHLGIAPK